MNYMEFEEYGIPNSYLTMALAMAAGHSSHRVQYGEEFQPIPKHIDAHQQAQQKINKGLTLFDIDGVKVWALNRKNAEKKAKRAKASGNN